jgi:hypothetical protein
MRKGSMFFMFLLKVIYGIYNAVAISIVVLLFISQKGWIAKSNNRVYKRI